MTASGDLLELALDISVISGAAPNSAIYLYGASAQNTGVTSFQAYQNAFFDSVRNPEVLSSSWTYFFSATPQSLFQQAWQQLFVDGLLSGVSTHIAIQDQGSNGWQSNGTGNVPAGTVPTYALSVGGTSASTPYSAANDATLASYYQLAMQGDMATIFELVEAGLITLPSKLSTANPATLTAGAARGEMYAGELTQLIETVWNEYVFVPRGNELHVRASPATTRPRAASTPPSRCRSTRAPSGSRPARRRPSPNGNGRGAPDVSALAGGNAYYAVLNSQATSATSRARW